MPVSGLPLLVHPLAASGTSGWESVIPQPWLAAAGIVCAIAATVWGRAASRLARTARRIHEESLASGTSSEAADLARSAYTKDFHATVLYSVLAAGLLLASFSTSPWFEALLLAVSVPAVFRSGTRPGSWPKRASQNNGPSSSAEPRRSSLKSSSPRASGQLASPPRPCPCTRASTSAAFTKPAQA